MCNLQTTGNSKDVKQRCKQHDTHTGAMVPKLNMICGSNTPEGTVWILAAAAAADSRSSIFMIRNPPRAFGSRGPDLSRATRFLLTRQAEQ